MIAGSPQIMEPDTHDRFAFVDPETMTLMADLSPNARNFATAVAEGRITW